MPFASWQRAFLDEREVGADYATSTQMRHATDRRCGSSPRSSVGGPGILHGSSAAVQRLHPRRRKGARYHLMPVSTHPCRKPMPLSWIYPYQMGLTQYMHHFGVVPTWDVPTSKKGSVMS